MKLYIKYMVSARCKMIVEAELKKLGLQVVKVELGSAEIKEFITKEQREKLDRALKKSRLEIMENQKSNIVENIKKAVDDVIYNSEEIHQKKFSDYISRRLCLNYTYLSNIFSEVTGCTIENFIIRNKIERVKYLLINSDLNLTQISYQLHYSSVAHLSNQFKKMTGETPSRYKNKNEESIAVK